MDLLTISPKIGEPTEQIEYLIIPLGDRATSRLARFIDLEKKSLDLAWRGGEKKNGKWQFPNTLFYSVREKGKEFLSHQLEKFGIPIAEIEFKAIGPRLEKIPRHIKKALKLKAVANKYHESRKSIEALKAIEQENSIGLLARGDISVEDFRTRVDDPKFAEESRYLEEYADSIDEDAKAIYEEGEEELKAGKENPIDLDEVISEFNRMFAILEVPQFGIMEFGKDKIWVHKKRDLLDRFQNQKLIIGYTSSITGEPKPIYKTKAEIWLGSPDRNTYYTIDFRPDQPPGEFTENGKRIYNSWIGLFVKPRKGHCELFKTHMLEIICAGDRANFDYLWRLVSNWVQRPWERSCAPVFRGAQGIGKGAFTETIGKIFGPTYFLTNEHEQVFGRFNAAIMGKVLLHLDEALVDGGRRFIGKVKGIITGPQFPIEMKGRDPISMNNPRKMMISSNESFAIPVDADDRRFLFLNVVPHRARDAEYFKNLFHEIHNGGIEALLYDLLNTDLKGFDPMRLPRGGQRFGFDNKIASAGSFHKFLFQAFSQGTFNLAATAGKWTTEIRTDLLYDHYLKFCDSRKLRLVMDEEAGRELQKMLGKVGFSKTRRRFDGDPKYVYVVPGLTKCREAFAEAYKTTSTNIFCED